MGTYSYGTAAHQDAVTSIQSGSSPSYTASYDADGSMTCCSTSTTPTLSYWNGNTGGQKLG